MEAAAREAVAEVEAAAALEVAAAAATVVMAVARVARVAQGAVGDRHSVAPPSGKLTGMRSEGHGCGRMLARARADDGMHGVVEVG